METTGLMDGSNVTHDYHISGVSDALFSGSVVISGLVVTGSQVASGKALIKCTRANGQVFFATYMNTAALTIDTTGTKKVFVAIAQTKIDDGSANNADGTGIATIQTAASYPSTGAYVPLASIISGVITDERPLYVKQETISTPIASATTTDLSGLTGDSVHITGITAITSLGVVKSGVCARCIFEGSLTLTHNATSLILPTGSNISTAAGDSAVFLSEGSGNWRCISYQKKNGQALSNPAQDVFSGNASDGIQSDANLTITGSNNSIIVKNFASWSAGSVARTATITPTGCITIIKIKGDADFTNWTFNWSGKGMEGGTGGAGNTNPNTSNQGGAVGNVSIASALTYSSTVPTGGVAGNNNAAANTTGAGGGGSGGGSGANLINNGASGIAGTGGSAQGAGGTGGIYTNRLLSMLSIQPMKHIPILVPQGGSGGQGGGAGATNGGTSVTAGTGGAGGTGGAAGGLLIIQVGGNLTLGNVSFNMSGWSSIGGTGGNASAGGSNAGAGGGGGGGGGGGAGGFLCVFYNGTLTGSTTPNVSGGTSAGGTGGTGINGGSTGTTGSAGGVGAAGGYIIEKNISF